MTHCDMNLDSYTSYVVDDTWSGCWAQRSRVTVYQPQGKCCEVIRGSSEAESSLPPIMWGSGADSAPCRAV